MPPTTAQQRVAHSVWGKPDFVRRWRDRVRDSTLGTRLLHGSLWSLTAAALAKGFNLFTWMIVARLVGRKAFGELALLDSTFGLLQNVGLFGLAAMATRYVALWREPEKERAGLVMGLSCRLAAMSGTVLAAALFLAAPWVARGWLHAPALGGLLRLGSVLLIAYSVTGVLEGSMVGLEGFKPLALVYLMAGLVSLPLYSWGAWQWNLRGVVIMMIGVAFLVTAVEFGVLTRLAGEHGLRIRLSGALREARGLWNFTVPVFLASQTYIIGNWVASCLLARGTAGYSELGIYSAAARWQQVVSFLPYYVGRALFPALTERLQSRDHRACTAILKYYLLLATGIATVFAVALMLLSRLVMSGYGASFADGWPVLVVLALVVVLLPLRWTIEMIYRAIGVTWYELALNVSWVLVLIGGVLWIPARGAWRLALANFAAFAVTNFAAALHIAWRIRRSHWLAEASQARDASREGAAHAVAD